MCLHSHYAIALHRNLPEMVWCVFELVCSVFTLVVVLLLFGRAIGGLTVAGRTIGNQIMETRSG